MIISIAQSKSIKGNIDANIENHLRLIEIAIEEGSDAIFFPELSITGYEPELASQLALNATSSKFDVFQNLSNLSKITIGFGLPTPGEIKPFISMAIFQANQPRIEYSKQFLHDKEDEYFQKGNNQVYLNIHDHKIAPAICYEASVIDHFNRALSEKATIYLASTLNPISGIDKELEYLQSLSSKNKLHVLMSNYAGKSGAYISGGKSSVWSDRGELIAQMDDSSQGLIIYNTSSYEVKERQLE